MALPDTSKKRRSSLYVVLVILLIVACVAIYSYLSGTETAQTPTESPITQPIFEYTPEVQSASDSAYRQFTDNEFNVLFENVNLPNTTPITEPLSIAQDTVLDSYIRAMAEARGYALRMDVEDITILETVPSIFGQVSLQPKVISAWESMRSAMSDDGINVSLTSGYRSPAEQLNVFSERMLFEEVEETQVPSGSQDEALQLVLDRAAPPGYSKHHTGYAIDMLCPGWEFRDFKSSSCHEWLTRDNYENAKKHGFIPSYPSESDLQGPLPEAWEYLYVGSEFLEL